MPFVKNISLTRRKTAAAAPAMSFSIIGTATGSAGYFTGSNSKIYSGATTYIPIYITLSTSSMTGGTPPYICKWTASTGTTPIGYVSGDNTGSITLENYSLESERWIATITDSSTPPNVVSSSFDSIIYGYDFEMAVGTWTDFGLDFTGSDNQDFDPNKTYVPGDIYRPLKTIDAAIRYAVPNETIIYVASGTYAENPVLDKQVRLIDGTADIKGSPTLGSGNYFIYARKDLTGSYSNVSGSIITGFISSSFSIIGVSPSGSIQNAMFDVEPSGTVKILSGVHEISTPISYSLNKAIYIDGITVPTGSSDTYIYQPSSILRMVNQNINMFDSGTPTAVNTGDFHKISNLALEIYTGSFFFFPNGVSRNIYLESVKFRLISASVAYDMMTLNNQPTITSHMNASGETTRPDERNIRSARYIKDAVSNQGNGWGTGKVLFGPYSPIGINNFSNSLISFSQHFEANSHELLNPVSQSRMRYVFNAMHNSFDNFSDRVLNISLLSRRPTYAKNNSNFNGLSYLSFDGVDEFLSSLPQSLPANHVTSSCIGYCVFAPNATPTGTNKAVVWKFGDYQTGFSLVLTGSRAAFNFYATSSNVTSSVIMLGNITTNQPYLLEFFFDGNSTNKRVGVALYGTSSMITSSYFSSTQFSSNKFYYVYKSDYAATSIGGAEGEYRHDNDLSAILNESRIDFYNGRWAASIFIPNDTGSELNTNSNKRQTEIYNYLRYKFFPTSSIVTRSISCDN